jgi:phosphate transport system substrate-binding protein
MRDETGLIGAGATFPAPLYQKWIAAFEAKNPGMPIKYEATGSAEGMRRLQTGGLDFAASDVLPGAGMTGVRTLPSVVGAVVPVYNLPGLKQDLRFSPGLLSGIFLGEITKWNDSKIKALNREVSLPDENIAVVHRSDGSGTTFVFSDFLAKTDDPWKSHMGANSTLEWPVGEGASGNDGVAAKVTGTKYSIGYVEFIYAVRAHLSFGSVQNAEGKFVRADIDSVTAAARTAQATSDFRISITNAAGKDAYPMASFTWLLIPAAGDGAKSERLRAFLQWALSNGQRQAAALGYIPLPEDLARRELISLSQR